MFFFISFAWFVAAGFAFLLAILSSNWLTFISFNSNTNTTVQRGIFYICYVLSSNNTYQATQCVSMINQEASTEPTRWIYEYAIASESLAIACAAFSVIIIWLFGIYFHVRRRTKHTLCFLLSISLLVLTTFCISFVIWILLISETLRLNISINRNMFNWPMWVAVGATGGYLMSFITLLLSFCTIYRNQSTMENNYYRPKNHF